MIETFKINNSFNVIGSGTTPKSGDESLYTDLESGIPWLNSGDLTNGKVENIKKKVSIKGFDLAFSGKKYDQESLAIAMYGATIGKTGLIEGGFVSNQACCILSSPVDVDLEYVQLVINNSLEELLLESQGGGQPNINQDTIRNFRFKAPTKEIQKKIIGELKPKLCLIEDKIKKLTKKLTLLDEYKTALIHNAVTKGLDANGCRILDGTPASEMKWKDSGVEWIGEIPEGWDVKSIKSIVSSFGEGGTPSTGNNEYWENGNIPWVTVSDICEEIISTKKMITKDGLNGSSANLWPVGTVILSNAATIGSVGIAKVPLCTKQGISGFVVNSDIDNYFFSQCLVDKKDRFNKMARETTFKSLNGTFLKNESIALPLNGEQKAISGFIKDRNKAIEISSNKIKQKISLLLEYKKSLINEAVTGNI